MFSTCHPQALTKTLKELSPKPYSLRPYKKVDLFSKILAW